MKTTHWVAILIALSIPSLVMAANMPCSGKKGGISHCQDGRFVCKDGSVSMSKKTCSGYGKKAEVPGIPTNAHDGKRIEKPDINPVPSPTVSQ
ncbi:MAG: hypothetical protein HQL77_07705 [Magnetococcales bacterium]|nr:hypothetical protein [Magnetococcales bacterium]MBF0435243.1 hypothetical protein [Magnetococcales bacterium]